MEEEKKGLQAKAGGDESRIITSTRKGDRGKTRLLSGEKVSKSHLRIEVGGNLDESNAALGLAKALTKNETIRSTISVIQKHLIILGGEISSGGPGGLSTRIEEEHIAQLEQWIESLQKAAPLPRRFVDPGANPVSAALDLARSIIRRLERSMVLLEESSPSTRQQAMSYVNRLACLVFTLARYAEKFEQPEPGETNATRRPAPDD
ncbi:MAG: cob(I)yrinic acid a,c-diamide adenosyltransferase [Deltaproteobacteria bacterium]|nr:cob(I)yrinic acid a,c-diamide adenosyltransferase [Deltaproteobacteria bacterium]